LGEQQQVSDSKDDYDVLPDVDHIPESFKESLKKQKCYIWKCYGNIIFNLHLMGVIWSTDEKTPE
ncbi:hypothetical protein WUBG_17118, partial [Wuchereria bancrofti]